MALLLQDLACVYDLVEDGPVDRVEAHTLKECGRGVGVEANLCRPAQARCIEDALGGVLAGTCFVLAQSEDRKKTGRVAQGPRTVEKTAGAERPQQRLGPVLAMCSIAARRHGKALSQRTLPLVVTDR
jgi:hypothetical protein